MQVDVKVDVGKNIISQFLRLQVLLDNNYTF